MTKGTVCCFCFDEAGGSFGEEIHLVIYRVFTVGQSLQVIPRGHNVHGKAF